MTTFVGQVTYKVDEKGRIPIPPSFRSALQDGGFLTPGAEGCITIYTRSKFDEIARTLQPNGLADGNNRKLSRALFSKASEFKMDAQGRVMLPLELRDDAGIADSATVVGVNAWGEIWSPERWKAQDSQHEKAWEVIDNLPPARDAKE
ncbi:MAG: division/cell wall cluster transcriptional repressor MraZ [Chloroflexi bacterium]|nr:division/cell wall cluster transcriptional repressor MraZ [Chloroflexota bacterium]